MNRHEWFDRAVSVLVLLVALGSFGVLIRKHIDEPQVSGNTNERSAKRIVKWAEISSEAKRVLRQDRHGDVILSVFTDFECPFCRRLDLDLPRKSGRVRDKNYAACCNCTSYSAGLT